MQQRKILFIDRDGTLIQEPLNYQVDTLEKVMLKEGVINALIALKQAGFRFVMITNQDGLGTDSFPQSDFDVTQDFVLKLFASQGITFEAIRICPHFAEQNCDCRKPKVGLILDYLRDQVIDRNQSFMIGDRQSDIEFAQNVGITGFYLGSEQFPNWQAIVKIILKSSRTSKINRKTNETDIRVEVDLDNDKEIVVDTGIGFFDHMLSQLAKHGFFGLQTTVKGDLHIDDHHTIEDTALALGQAVKQALGDKRGIERYAFVLPMDEAQVQMSIDICARPYFKYEGCLRREKVGNLATECVPHFFRSFAEALGAALHIKVSGENEHHMIEAMFKALGRCLRQAVRRDGVDMPSTKGIL